MVAKIASKINWIDKQHSISMVDWVREYDCLRVMNVLHQTWSSVLKNQCISVDPCSKAKLYVVDEKALSNKILPLNEESGPSNITNYFLNFVYPR